MKLTRELRELAVRSGDVVMVHASLWAIEPVDGGAAGVVSPLEAAVGASGTLVMNIGARDDFEWVDTRPQPERPSLLRHAPALDTDRTPADPNVGLLAELFVSCLAVS